MGRQEVHGGVSKRIRGIILQGALSRVLGARRFFLGTWNMKGFLSEERPIRTLREVLQRLREAYCGTIGYEARLLHLTIPP